MPDRRVIAMDRLNNRLSARAGQAVVYRRAAAELNITGVLTDPKSDSKEAALGIAAGLDLSGLDLIIKASDIASIGLPMLGDEIDAAVGGVTHTFIASRDAGEDVYRYVDPMRTMIRMHLTHLGEATP